jgi:hypothetical protein
LLGWIIGIFIGFYLVGFNLESIIYLGWKINLISDFHKPPPIGPILVWVPFGISIGLLQWFRLREFKIHPFSWILATAFGWTILGIFLSQAYDNSFNLHSSWLIYLIFVAVLFVGGASIGFLQSMVMKKSISMSISWMGANAFGLIIPLFFLMLAFLVKSIILKTFYFLGLYDLVALRGLLLIGFVIISGAISVTIPTGIIILNYVILHNEDDGTKTLNSIPKSA